MTDKPEKKKSAIYVDGEPLDFDPLELTEVQLAYLNALTCRVSFQLRQPCTELPPVTIEGLNIIHQEELVNGFIRVEFEVPEGTDPAELRRFFRAFGPLDQDTDFYKDYDT